MLSRKEVMKFMHSQVRQIIGDAAKPFGYKFRVGNGSYVLNRKYDHKNSSLKDKIIIGYDGLSYAGMPISVDKTYCEVQNLISPVIGKRYPKYLEQTEQEFTVYLFHFFHLMNVYRDKYYLIDEPLSSSTDEEEIPRKIEMVKEYILEVIIPELNKINDLHYLHKWLMSIIDVKHGVNYWGALQAWDHSQFHGFKHMAISKLIGGLDYEKVCAKMEEFIDGMRNETEPKYTNLKPTYEELREYLDKWEKGK